MVAAPSMPIPPPMSLEQWADMAEDEPGELVDGYLVEEEVPNHAHEAVVSWLLFVLMSWARPRRGVVFASEHKIGVAPTRGRKPDVTMYPPDTRLGLGSLSRKPPRLIVEVVSPDPRDVRRDRFEKANEYARFGVRSYWLFDPAARIVECFDLDPQGRWIRAVSAASGQVTVPGFDDLVLDLDDLWSEVDRVTADDPEDDLAAL
ncbi:Uma2 family endonuclease [Polyangium sp. y55x31]|uniref:Uma2 family endonuclease n=1 Tax=Polyangium sp. y55x31 TaxID=3042688 RepID=UPI0024821467|nr:Uma2 family endonuclease [Polyangium sp. y55x31]MDI1482133.1 Uma2 family endonuclease [Polyangium sp. y55x31]